MNKIKKISATQLSMFEECERKWWANYVLYIDRLPPTDAINLGLATHKILELSLIAMKKGVTKYSNPKALINSAIKSYKMSPADIARIPILLDNAIKMGWYKNFERSEPEANVLYKIGDVEIIAKIDRKTTHDDMIQIVDIKSGKYPYESYELKKNWQTKMYSIPFLGNQPVSMEFWFVRFFHKKPSIMLTESDKSIFIEQTEEVIDKMRQCDGTKYTTSRLCKWCGYYEQCMNKR